MVINVLGQMNMNFFPHSNIEFILNEGGNTQITFNHNKKKENLSLIFLNRNEYTKRIKDEKINQG